MESSLSIIIPHHRDEENLERLLRSIEKQITDFSFDVTVVSNPGSPHAQQLCQHMAYPCSYQVSQLGANFARNKGIQTAQSDLALFLDSDCLLVDPLLLQKHYNFHKTYPEVTCLGGSYSNASISRTDEIYNQIQQSWLVQGSNQGRNYHLLGGHFSCKTSHLDHENFDENLIYGGTETEFFLRLRKKDLICVFDANISVLHNTSLSVRDLAWKRYRQGQGSAYISEKHKVFLSQSPSTQYTFDDSEIKKDWRSTLQLRIFLRAFDLGLDLAKPELNLIQKKKLLVIREAVFFSAKILDIVR